MLNFLTTFIALIKNMYSKSAALLLFIFLLPINFIIAVIIILDDGFPFLYKQKRIGKDNKIFSLYKFRTMKNKIPDIPTHLLNNPKKYFIRTGASIRKLSLDELPQLINIIKGEMVFIGPRPALYNQEDLIKLRTAKNIHKLKPGITGLAQINGRDDLSIEQKVTFDALYFKHKSLFINIKIIFLTVKQILLKKGISH